MVRRDENEEEFQHWLRAIGRRLADHRRSHGLTQFQAADRCAMDLKQYQDIEYGRRAMGLRTTFALAGRLGLDTGAWLAASDLPSRDRVPSGWRAVPAQAPGAIPIFDTMAGIDNAAASWPEPGCYAVPPRQLGRALPADQGWFVARVSGESLPPAVTSGTYCLFRRQVDESIVGKIVLTRGEPSGNGGLEALKWVRVGALEALGDGFRVRLDTFDAHQPSEWRDVATVQDLKLIGQFVEDLSTGPSA